MIRAFHIGGILLAALVACGLPTDACACTYPVSAAIVFGVVRTATETPVAGATVHVETSPGACTEPRAAPIVDFETTAADGRYRVVSRTSAVGPTCVVVQVTVGGASASAPATVQSRRDSRQEFLDSVRVDLRLP